MPSADTDSTSDGPARRASANSYDLIVVGAGIIGLCTAWQVARRSGLRIAVLENGAGVGAGSTGASSAVCRFRYSLDSMVQLARDGIDAYRNWQAFTGLAAPRASFQSDGVLWLPGADQSWAAKEHSRMRLLGVRTEVLDDQDLHRRFPSLSSCTLAPDLVSGEAHPCMGGGRHLLEIDGGYMDPVACVADLVEACTSQGVDVKFNTLAAQVLTAGGRVSGVLLGDGSRLAAPMVINATGPWCNTLPRDLGLQLAWNLTPTRIQVLCLDRPPQLRGHIPVTVDLAGGIYFRLQSLGQQIVVGSILAEDEQERVPDPDDFNHFADEAFLQAKLHALHHRIQGLPYRGRVRGYSGLYTVNEQDVHPVVGETSIDGFYLANGFSGHGFKLAPAIGALLAQIITGARGDFDTAIGTDFFSPQRQPFRLPSRSVLA